MHRNHTSAGFTLLELLVVVAILVVVAGGLIAAFDGLEQKSAQGVATFDIAALDNAIRTFRASNSGQFPDEWDSMLFSPSGDGAPATIEAMNIVHENIRGNGIGGSNKAKLGAHTLSAAELTALANAGIRTVRYLNGAAGYNNADPTAGGTQVNIPNRVFDNPTRGFGVRVTLAAGMALAAVENILQADFETETPANSARLRDIAGLAEDRGHVVIAFGVGNNSTLVGNDGRQDARSASLSQAPFYKNIAPNLYGRYIALFHLATDNNVDGDTTDAGETLGTARFIGVIDTRGDFYEEEEAEFTGIKS